MKKYIAPTLIAAAVALVAIYAANNVAPVKKIVGAKA